MSALEEARTILNRRGLATDALYKEQQLEKAQALATLAVAEALEALLEANKTKDERPLIPMAYALTRKLEGREHSEVMSIYTEQDTAMNEAASLNKLAKDMGSAVTWGVSPYVRK